MGIFCRPALCSFLTTYPSCLRTPYVAGSLRFRQNLLYQNCKHFCGRALAGNIQKEHEKESEVFWTSEDQRFLSEELNPTELTFLNPAFRTEDLSDQKSVFGRDMTQVFFADVMLVDARERRGLGVGAEMMWAKMNRIPVLTLAPVNSHYRKKEVNLLGVHVDNWVHPFVESLSDGVINDLKEAAKWLKELMQGTVKIKGSEFISKAIYHYQTSQLPHDTPMKELIEENSAMKFRLEHACSLMDADVQI